MNTAKVINSMARDKIQIQIQSLIVCTETSRTVCSPSEMVKTADRNSEKNTSMLKEKFKLFQSPQVQKKKKMVLKMEC